MVALTGAGKQWRMLVAVHGPAKLIRCKMEICSRLIATLRASFSRPITFLSVIMRGKYRTEGI